ncbi:hypothetical protein [Candidatus Berkiella aquae]|uniref:Prepilin-type N-terminal cleavage/methylation domain-containing protein n=1 Tax=Candidatus Berkiella aquae TaxID=295108 RepID=A0A0Q9YSC1_9GAMM|nr:hypothetical protein [Candidatus Berkiella aquae]MCS5711847.1 hypothetical protein [Candidatus Berkiella aquae]
MNEVCSPSVSVKWFHNRGYGFIEVLIALVIFLTTLLSMIGIGLKQIQQTRESLLLNQLHFQVDTLSLLIHQHSSLESAIFNEWQKHFQELFPQAKINFQSQEQGFVLNLRVLPYHFKVITHRDGVHQHKTISRTDSS